MNESTKNEIKFITESKMEGQVEILNALKAKQRILELFETEEIEKIEITLKQKADSK
mgnify:CR=1 FL=1